MNAIRPYFGLLKLLILFIFTITFILGAQILYFILFLGSRRYVWLIPSIWHFWACKTLNIKVNIIGEDARKNAPNTPILYAANHLSYMDIPILGRYLQGMFIAKSDIAKWPIIGPLCHLQGTMFIKRQRSEAEKQKARIRGILNKGLRLVLFPEGTTTNGESIGRFKSTLFGALIENMEREILVQPITLRYTKINGKTINDQKSRDLVAWYGDDTLAHHMWNALKQRRIDVDIIFHSPLSTTALNDRKLLAQAAEDKVREGYQS